MRDQSTEPDDRAPIDIARDMLAACLAAEFGEGITVTHDVTGWQARRNGVVFARAQSGPALRALAPYLDPGPDPSAAANGMSSPEDAA